VHYRKRERERERERERVQNRRSRSKKTVERIRSVPSPSRDGSPLIFGFVFNTAVNMKYVKFVKPCLVCLPLVSE